MQQPKRGDLPRIEEATTDSAGVVAWTTSGVVMLDTMPFENLDLERPTPMQRFVAGEAFFNYANFGSLRPWREPIRLTSSRYVGLAVQFALCGFAYFFFSYAYCQLLAEEIKAVDESQVEAAQYVLIWPQCCAVLFGFLSDTLPIKGVRRKSYMIVGWLLSLVMFGVVAILDSLVWGDRGDARDHHNASQSKALLAVSVFACIGIQITWIAAMAASVEIAQSEPLRHRGETQATLICLYHAGGALAQAVTGGFAIVAPSGELSQSTLTLTNAAAIMMVVTILALPFIVLLYEEEPPVDAFSSLGVSPRRQFVEFWKFCHQNVVRRVVFFATCHLFFVGFFSDSVRDAVAEWSHVGAVEVLFINIVRMTAMALGILVWRYLMLNSCWKRVATWGSAFHLLCYAVVTLLTTLNVVRAPWFYGLMMALSDVPRAWLVLYATLLTTEIADIGREGMTLGLVISFQMLSGLAVFTLAEVLPGLFGGDVTMDQVHADKPSTHEIVGTSYAVTLGVNLLSFFWIRMLPQQKLDAQQLRAFGGYNRIAGVAIAVMFFVLLVFNLTANVMVVL
ncbi:hypothetical protein ATCC90586_000960 [Pythium insidiosum]|nr:hypothetical protein ATCC90586_000960 [Pythium insidiosum]